MRSSRRSTRLLADDAFYAILDCEEGRINCLSPGLSKQAFIERLARHCKRRAREIDVEWFSVCGDRARVRVRYGACKCATALAGAEASLSRSPARTILVIRVAAQTYGH